MAKPPRAPDGGSKPPAAAVLVIVGAVVGAPVVAWVLGVFGIDWRSLLPWRKSDNWYIAAVFAPMVLLVVVALITKLVETRRASKWAQTTGRIVKSGMEARHHQFAGEAETVTNTPAVRYEFSAGGVKYTGARIAIGGNSGAAETVLARYPAGKSVAVFYDPSDPNECVLERDIPKGILSGCLLMAALAAAAAAGIYYATTNATRLIGNYIPAPEHAPFVVAISCFGLVVFLFFFGYRRYVKSARAWPTVPGRVLESRVDSYETRENGRLRTTCTPVIEYAYAVHGNEYRGRQIRLGLAVEGSRTLAEKTVARYPQGSEVVVHYDPANAANAALERPGGYPWLLLVVAAFCFGAAIFASGLFR